MPNVEVDAPSFVQAETDGGAWIEAECMGCTFGDGYGYSWTLDGELVGENEPLAVRVESVGTYAIELNTYGFACDVEFETEVTVGKYLLSGSEGLEWLGAFGGQMGIRFPEVWNQVNFRWFDASGRLVDEGNLSEAIGEVFIEAPNARGWMTLELRSSDGRVARWAGIL